MAIDWDFGGEEGGLRLRWTERGGPAVAAPPTQRGFGSRLLATLAERQLGGRLGFDWRPEGLRACLELRPKHAAPTDASSFHAERGPPVPRRVLPPAPALIPPLAGALEAVPAQAPRPRVLLVEDDVLLSMEIETALRALGCDVVGPARNLSEAVRFAASEPELHAAVLDVNLGNGERVFAAADLLATRGVPVLFSTGYSSAESLEGRDAVAVTVLRKPYPREALAAALQAALRREGTPATN